jgi:long-chain fatty acid transport protein
MRRVLTGLLSGAALASIVAPTPAAQAGGMYFTDRGARPAGRGFAFVAGADDAGALWYNPAGLAHAGRQVFVDTTLTLLDAEFTRIDGGGAVQPTVSLEAPPLPIPMLAYTDGFGLERFNFGAGVLAPNLVPKRWPAQITVAGVPEPAPQRYSLIDLDGSAIVHVVAGGAFRLLPELTLGATAHVITGRLRSRQTLSACDRAICTQPENPDFDAESEIDLPFVGVTATFGAQYDAGPVRLGASFTLPHRIGGTATMRVRVPAASVFDGAFVDGDTADVTLDMAWIARAGVELRAIEDLRVEAAVVYEGWSIQDELLVEPENVTLRNVVAIGDYDVGDVAVPRDMNDVVSLRLGGEYAFVEEVTARAGVTYETGAFDDEYLTPLTLDSDKIVVGVGASVQVADGVWLDASYGHVFLRDREVRTSRVPQPNPIRPPPANVPPPDGPVFVGNGDYLMEANVFGVGLRWTITPPPAVEPGPEPDAEPSVPRPAPPAARPAPEPAPVEEPAPVDAPTPVDETPPEETPAEVEPGDDDVPWYYRRGRRP